ncbi:response regulator [Aliiroseovarius sp. YM-037]|uniref:response regulator n=1 Tax=Aliiroseovarius sp. YM-037 TaxID=3341728 RepID=UPI003A80A3E9
MDDDDDIRAIVGLALETVGGLKVVSCRSGIEALTEALNCQPDLFLLDVMMPGMSGQETWEKLSQLPGLEDVPAIFMTAKAQDDFSDSLMQIGALDVITKPFNPVELATLLKNALRQTHSD